MDKKSEGMKGQGVEEEKERGENTADTKDIRNSPIQIKESTKADSC